MDEFLEDYDNDIEDLLAIHELMIEMEECDNITDLVALRFELTYRVNALEKRTDRY